MSDRHVIIGAGPVGRSLAAVLTEQGSEVVLGSRSGTGPEVAGVQRAAVDAASADDLARLAEGATVLYNCLNPTAYHKWSEEWPPMAAALLAAAERSGAVLAVAGNLYPYGETSDGRMVEGQADRPGGTKASIRATMTADGLAAHRDGRIRYVEVRASDYMGAGPGDYAHVPRVIAKALQGKKVAVVGSPDQPHTWTHIPDLARSLAVAGQAEKAWGKIWHAPSNEPRTQREAIADVCRSVGREPVKVGSLNAVLTVASPFWVLARELKETAYQFNKPYLMESSVTQQELGVEPTPWVEVCRATANVETSPDK